MPFVPLYSSSKVIVTLEAIIFGIFWVISITSLSKCGQILLKFGPVMKLRFFIKSQKFQEIKPKNWFSGLFSEVFRLRLLLCPLSYALIFLQINGLIKIHNRGKFYDYSIFDCLVISFSYRFSIHEMALLGEVLGLNTPKYCQILLKFSPQVKIWPTIFYF